MHALSLRALCAPLVLAGAAAAQDSAAKRPLTPQAAIQMRTIEELRFTPDGARLAFVVSEAPKGTGRVRHIWILDVKSGDVRQFTFSEKSEGSPRWSPDGKTLAFLSDRNERNQVYLMPAEGGGEARALTTGKRAVSAFAWSPDGSRIAFLAPDTASDAQNKKEKDKNDARVEDKDDRHDRLWVQPVTGGDARPLTPPSSEVSELAWGMPGDRIIVSITETPWSDENTHRIAAVHVADGRTDSIAAPRGPFYELTLSPSGKTVGYVGARGGGPEAHDLFTIAVAGGAPRNVTAAPIDRPIVAYHFTGDDAGLMTIGDGFRNALASWSATSARRDAMALAVSPGTFAVAPSGEVAFVAVTPTSPPEILLWDRGSPPRPVTHVNDGWSTYALVTPQFFTYKSFDGRAIEAALMQPAGWDGKKKLPLVVLVHGGPTSRWTASIEPWGQLLAAHGYAVLYANIRGSTGYGNAFSELNRADWGGADFKDLMAGVDAVIARGVADSTRLGIGGWSYGGYMAEWAITQTTRFKAAVSGAGMANLASEFGTESSSAYDEWFWGTPYEHLDRFSSRSPIAYLKNAKTPTLIMQGDADLVDPLGQSQELYRGLKHYGVEAELVVYPREPHGFREEMHLIDRLERILAWYDKYLK